MSGIHDRTVSGDGKGDGTGHGSPAGELAGAGGEGPRQFGETLPPRGEAAGPRGSENELDDELDGEALEPTRPNLTGRQKGRRVEEARALAKPEERSRSLTPEQRLVILDTWRRSGLPAKDFGAMVGLSKDTLYGWQHRFEKEGPAGLDDKPRGGPKGSKLSEGSKRAIRMMKDAHPEWGTERIHHLLLRTEGFFASPGAIANFLKEEGYEGPPAPPPPHDPPVRHFERSEPNGLWQTDFFTFILKRQNRRVYLVIFMDDHSRFIVGYGLGAKATGELVREVFEAAIASHGAPEEVLTDNGSQYKTWRGTSEFAKLCEKRGVKHIVARPRHPQTLGKAERFWGTLWRECLESAIFLDLEEARARIGHFIDAYNFMRPHQGIEGLVPADRFFRAAPEVLATLRARVAENAAELARDGLPRKDFYLAGRVGGLGISLHAEGEKVVLVREDGKRETVDLRATGRRADPAAPQAMPVPLATEGRPASGPEEGEREPLERSLERLEEALGDAEEGDEEGGPA